MELAGSELPLRSAYGLAALDIFFIDFNDVNFYVEDIDQENLYYESMKKLFLDIAFERIFPLGGKEALISHAQSQENQDLPARRIYILDRDFDSLLGREAVGEALIYLDVFCIENHLLENAAIIEIVIESQPKCSRLEVASTLHLEQMIPETYASLRPLFQFFFCAQALDLGIKNSSSAPEAFCEPKKLWRLQETRLQEYREELAACASANGMERSDFVARCEAACTHAETESNERLVSGKFVAAMIFRYVKSKYNLGTITFESFLYRLAKNCTLESMGGFAERVRASLREQGRVVNP